MRPAGNAIGWDAPSAADRTLACPGRALQSLMRTSSEWPTFSQHLVEVGAEGGVDLRGTGEPQPKCDVAGSDEVIKMGEVAGRRRSMLSVALKERRTELLVVVSVSQFP